MNSYSQYGQDIEIYNQFFKNKIDGVFVDIGAHDGITLSNTYMYEQLGWKGYCFEPNPSLFKSLVANRPNSKCFNFAIGPEEKQASFLKVDGYAEMLSGLVDHYRENHKQRIKNEIIAEGGEALEISVDVKVLDQNLCPETDIDFLSVDTEGGEHLIIKSVLAHFTPRVVTIEANTDHDFNEIIQVMAEKYNYVGGLGCDRVFVAK